MDEQPHFKQEFYGQWVTNPKYEIYSPTEFYLLQRSKSKDKPLMSMSSYREWGGWWLVEFIDDEMTDYWRFEYRHQANFWKQKKQETQGKAEIVFPIVETK